MRKKTLAVLLRYRRTQLDSAQRALAERQQEEDAARQDEQSLNTEAEREGALLASNDGLPLTQDDLARWRAVVDTRRQAVRQHITAAEEKTAQAMAALVECRVAERVAVELAKQRADEEKRLAEQAYLIMLNDLSCRKKTAF
ncbi:MAG: hypothetical protein AB7F35_00115 [Acetobacteraceae bacterium]